MKVFGTQKCLYYANCFVIAPHIFGRENNSQQSQLLVCVSVNESFSYIRLRSAEKTISGKPQLRLSAKRYFPAGRRKGDVAPNLKSDCKMMLSDFGRREICFTTNQITEETFSVNFPPIFVFSAEKVTAANRPGEVSGKITCFFQMSQNLDFFYFAS